MTAQTLSTFNFESHAIRTIAINGEPWFLSVDICNALNISNSRDAISKLDEDEYQTLNLKDTVGLTDSIANQVQSVGIVSESGMYTLILRCREAVKKGSVPHRFRKWVTAEVLPQIRKTGSYERKTTVDERTGLRDAVNMLVSKRGLMYSEAYQLVHQRFNVPSIENLTAEQLPQAVEYVHKICLEGELIIEPQARQITATEIKLAFKDFLPFVLFFTHWQKAVSDFQPLSNYVKYSGNASLAEIIDNHFREFNEQSALCRKVKGAIYSAIAQIENEDERYFIDCLI